MRFAGPRLDGDEAAQWLMIGWEYDAVGNTNGNGDMEMRIGTASSIWTVCFSLDESDGVFLQVARWSSSSSCLEHAV